MSGPVKKTVTVTAITPIGQGKVGTVDFKDGDHDGRAKAFLKERDSSDTWTVGETLEVEFEKKDNEYNGKTTVEIWIKKPQSAKPKFGGGGPGKADPAKLAIEQEKLNLEKVKMNRFEAKWESDRGREMAKQSFIMAQTAIARAVDIELHNAKVEDRIADMNNVRALAADLGYLTGEVSAEILQAISDGADGGK